MDKKCLFCDNYLPLELVNYKIAKYCNAECRNKARDFRRGKLPKEERFCLYCNDLITTQGRRDKVYCSPTCKTKGFNKKSQKLLLCLDNYKHLITDDEGYSTIKISGIKDNDKEFLVDNKYLKLLQEISNNWYYTNGYARSSRDIKVHRVIAQLKFGEIPSDKMVDHINRNKLDNRESNLRLASHAENSLNRECNLKNTLYKGVRKDGNKYTAIICVDNNLKYLGRFNTPEEAAKAYNDAAILYYNPEFAILNKLPE